MGLPPIYKKSLLITEKYNKLQQVAKTPIKKATTGGCSSKHPWKDWLRHGGIG